jgi:PAP2 superfamily
MAGNSRTRYRFQDPYSTDDYLPVAGLLSGTLLAAEVAGDSYGKGEVATMLEASIFSAVTAEGLKYAAGHERPNETLDPNDWRMSGSSFPSLHCDLAFAIGTVFAESGDDDHRWFCRFIGYGIGTATVYLRLHDNAHWFSDTVAGAAIGVASEHCSINRRLEHPDDHPEGLNISVVPIAGGGLKLAFSLTMD